VLIISAVLASAGFDVARHVAASLFAQQVRHAKQIVGADSAPIDKRLAAHHGFQREPLAGGFVRLGEIKKRELQPGDRLAHEERAALPQQANKGIDCVSFSGVAERIQRDALRALDKVVEDRRGHGHRTLPEQVEREDAVFSHTAQERPNGRGTPRRLGSKTCPDTTRLSNRFGHSASVGQTRSR
jgi:hypothetical protein